jgi:hypothetical protein
VSTDPVVTSSTRFRLGPQISLQELGPDEGGVVLRLDSGELYTINDTTLAFLRGLDGKKTMGDVARSMLDVFEVDEPTLIADITEIAADLVREKVIVVVS